MKTIWILTRAINAYDQEGDYFMSAWLQKPTRQELLKLLYEGSGENKDYNSRHHAKVGHILEGGGREKIEHEWYYLKEIKSGTIYQ